MLFESNLYSIGGEMPAQCQFCDAPLTEKRHATIEGITYVFCPAPKAIIGQDCVNEFLKQLQQQTRCQQFNERR